jgi:hypothetical protein
VAGREINSAVQLAPDNFKSNRGRRYRILAIGDTNSPRGEELRAFPGERVSLKAGIESDNDVRVWVGFLEQRNNSSGGKTNIFEVPNLISAIRNPENSSEPLRSAGLEQKGSVLQSSDSLDQNLNIASRFIEIWR